MNKAEKLAAAPRHGIRTKEENTLWLQKQVFGNESLVRRFVEFIPSLEGFPRVVSYQSSASDSDDNDEDKDEGEEKGENDDEDKAGEENVEQ